jgi:hypothetical protein
VVRRLVEAVVVILTAGSLYQLAVAVGLIPLGNEPGDGPRLEALFFDVPVYTLVLGGVVLAVCALVSSQAVRLSRYPAFRALSIAAAAFPVCHALAFDPYYLPTKLRFQGVEPVWPLLLALLAIGATVLCVRRPGSTAVGLTAVVMVASGVVAVGQGLH